MGSRGTMRTRLARSLSFALLLAAVAGAHAAIEPDASPIDHLLVIYLENHTFDNLFGLFPGGNGVRSPSANVRQVDRGGTPYDVLPQVTIGYPYPPKVDPRFPAKPPNQLFAIGHYVPIDAIVEMPVHRYYPNILQIAGGKNDRFVSWGDSGALPMGYFDTTKLPLYPYARRDVLADNWFTSAFAGFSPDQTRRGCPCSTGFP